MLLFVVLFIINLPIILIGFSGFFACCILLVLFLITRNKKKLVKKNEFLQNELDQLRSILNEKKDHLEENIIARTAELRKEIEFRKTVDLDRRIALKNAEEANFLKNAFLANMSHEIRTPLNSIQGFSHLLLNEVKFLENPELIDLASGIAESSYRLLKLMENIIDLSRIDANFYNSKINTFDVNTVINSCIERIKPQALEKNLELIYNQDEIYYTKGDKPAFEKSVDLILENALKYTITGAISIILKADYEKNKLRVLISDTGIGIDKSFLANIFNAFRQGNTGYNQIEKGAGLGLPLAQRLMQIMDGEIQIESKISRGTQVSLLLDLGKKTESGIIESTLNDDSISNISKDSKTLPYIFIVEDDKMNRKVFEKMLESYAEIKIAIDGDFAIKQINETIQANKIPDIILLDINLPEPWDGILLLKEFKKKWPVLNTIPFIAQTAYAMTGDKERFLAEGFDDYISKPIDKKELFTIIENNMHKFSAFKK